MEVLSAEVRPPTNRVAALTVDEFLRWARIGRTKFYREVNSGKIPLKKLGTKSLVLWSDAEAWMENLPQKESNSEKPA